tara:strand:- start:178 stop:1119 length:942 start_codon:yes stop_codon:yes gene_type:complete
MEVKTTIYQATNLKNNKVYIGSTIRSLKETKFHHESCTNRGVSRPLYDGMRKHGFYNFLYNTMEEFQSQDEAYEFKEVCIAGLNAMNPKYGYNCTTGRLDRYKMNKETREKISEIQTGKIMPESFVKLMKERVGKKHPMFGKKRSKKVRENMRLGQLNSDYVPSEETKKKTSEKMKKRWKNPTEKMLKDAYNKKHQLGSRDRRGKKNPMYGKGMKGKDNPMYGVTGKDHPNYGTTISKEQINLMQKGQEKYREKRRKEALARTEKKCNKCNNILNFNMFYKNRSSLDGVDYHCKECDKKRKEKYGTSKQTKGK